MCKQQIQLIMGNLLDKLFKEKLTNRKIDFEAADWAAMESILDNGNPQTPTSAIGKFKPFTLIVASLLFLGLLLGGLYFSNQLNSIAPNEGGQKGEIQVPTPIEKENTPIASTAQNMNRDKASFESSSQVEDENLIVERKLARVISSEDLNSESKESFDIEEGRSQADLIDVKNTAHGSSTLTSPTLSNDRKNTSFLDESSSNEMNAIAENAVSNPLDRVVLEHANNHRKDILSKSFTLTRLPLIEFSQLDGYSHLLDLPNFDQYVAMKRLQETQSISVRPQAGLHLAAYRSAGDLKIGAGFFKEFNIGDRVSLSLEPSYLYTRLAVESIARDTSDFYSFGVSSYAQNIVTERVHAVQLPVYVQYKKGSSTFSGGLSYQRILAIGALRTVSVDDAITESNKIWLTEEFYNTSLLQASLQYQYQLTPFFRIGGIYEIPIKGINSFNSNNSLGLILKYSI